MPADASTPSAHRRSAAWGWGATLLKYLVSLALVGWLAALPSNRAALLQAWSQPKDGFLLCGAVVLCTLAAGGTFFRWWTLLRAAGVPCGLAHTVQVGFASYLLNFLALGMVGGELFKFVSLSHRHRAQHHAILASLFVDRLIGLVGLFLLAALAGALSGAFWNGTPLIRMLCWAAAAGAAGGIAVWPVVAWIDWKRGGLLSRMHRGPAPFRWLARLAEGIACYRDSPRVVVAAVLQSMATQSMLAGVVWMVGHGLRAATPSWTTQCVVVPLANLSTTIPLPGGGLGAFEWVLARLYTEIPSSPQLLFNEGFLLAVGYRVVTLIVALVGLGFYLSGEKQHPARIDHADGPDPAHPSLPSPREPAPLAR